MKIPIHLRAGTDRRFDVVGFGENSLDLVTVMATHPGPNSKAPVRRLEQLPGGQVATAVVACARLGLRACYIGRFGDDAYGAAGIESLRREGVDVAFVEQIPGATSHFSVVIVDETRGERAVMFHHDPALGVPPVVVPPAAIRAGRVLLVDGVETTAAARAADVARDAGVAAVIDVEDVRPGIDTLLDRVDVVIAAERFPRDFTGVAETGAALAALAARCSRAAAVCVTLGKEGSLARCGGREIRTPACPVACVDSTGGEDRTTIVVEGRGTPHRTGSRKRQWHHAPPQ